MNTPNDFLDRQETQMTPTAPSAEARMEAAERLAGLAVPNGALGRLGELAIWLAGVQGTCPPWPVTNVRAVVFAGDHGVTEYGVSAYPKEITPAMVRAFLNGGAGVAVLARQHEVALRILDIGVDDDLDGVAPAVKEFKIGRSCRPIHLEDAISRNDCARALIAGRAVARQEIAAGADLLISGDMGIGNTTPAAALIAATGEIRETVSEPLDPGWPRVLGDGEPHFPVCETALSYPFDHKHPHTAMPVIARDAVHERIHFRSGALEELNKNISPIQEQSGYLGVQIPSPGGEQNRFEIVGKHLARGHTGVHQILQLARLRRAGGVIVHSHCRPRSPEVAKNSASRHAIDSSKVLASPRSVDILSNDLNAPSGPLSM